MKKITRKTFLKQAIGLGSLVAINPLILKSETPIPLKNLENSTIEKDFYKRLVAANTKAVEALVTTLLHDITELKRDLGFDFANLVSSYSEPTSKYFQKADLIPLMEKIINFLLKEQKADGTLNIGNFESPPDTAFILEPLCAATVILNKTKSTQLDNVKSLAKQFILKAGEAMTEGGIHTPNHRWVVSAALAQINDLYPNKKYLNRIEQWLAEGIFMDSEGHYLERSMIYSQVIDRSLITMARLLKRPEFLEPVRKNLEMVYFYLEPNGDVVTTDSRRQDQFKFLNALPFYLDYRYMAILDKNGAFSAIAQSLENRLEFDEAILSQSLFRFLEEPLLKKEMPTARPQSTDFEQFFKGTQLVRIMRNEQSATIYGGTDLPLIIGSGRSTSPNFFAFRKGDAIMKYW